MIFQHKLVRFLPSPPPFLLAKGRVALYAILKAMGLGAGDDVLMAGYTCLVVPTAAMMLGARPVYLDIDTRTYNIDPPQLDTRCTPAAKALIVQHTYGIPCRMDAISAWAAPRNIPVIEDCCLAFGSTYQGKLCGTFGTAAFFSGQWNKPFSTGLGGMLIVHDEVLSGKIQSLIDRELLHPTWARRFLIWAQIHLYERLVTPKTTPWITAVYRGLSKAGLAVGSSTRGEYDGKTPKNYFMAMTPAQAKKGAREMERIEANIARRRA
nr:DegT/DnrJ/EryC1/StrS family aminotransferase [bacterium]